MTDGSRYDAIIVPHGGLRNLATKESFDEVEISEGIFRSPLNTALNGFDVFNFSITEVPKMISSFLETTKTQTTDYNYFVMHQANLLMNESIRKKVKFEASQVPYTLSKFGNTSSASIPLTIVSELREQLQNESLNFIISGFGVGLSWGVASFNTYKIICPEIVEVA
jgi:3-oxoacyl-[acyl-carrier-protein] synthase-3